MPLFQIGTRRFCSRLLLIASFTATMATLCAATAVQAFDSPSDALLIDAEAGRLDARIHGRPTREVLEAVSRATGIRFFVEPSLLAVPLSARVEGLPLEEGLKRILGVHSYVMLFAAQSDHADSHRLKAVRVYPRGRFTAERYVLVEPEGNQTGPAGAPAVLSLHQVEALLQHHDEITRSATAQRIAARRSGRHAETRRGDRSPARTAFEQNRRARTLQQRKARTLARRHASEMQFLVEAREKRTAVLRSHRERQRQDARQSAVSGQSIH